MSNKILLRIQTITKITDEQIKQAKDCQIVNGCLILKNKRYNNEMFKEREDFRFLIAADLEIVSKCMFCKCKNLELVYASNVEQIIDGQVITQTTTNEKQEQVTSTTYEGAFSETKISHVHFPKLKRIADFAFYKSAVQNIRNDDLQSCKFIGLRGFQGCQILELSMPRLFGVGAYGFAENLLGDMNLPQLVKAGDFAFMGCRASEFNLPSLVFGGRGVFSDCYELSELKLGKVQLGEGSISGCMNLQVISCEAGKDVFVCNKKKEFCCPICRGQLDLCFEISESLQKIPIDQPKITKSDILEKILETAGITQDQVDAAEDCQVVNQVLILHGERYSGQTFQYRPDLYFRFVIAKNLDYISFEMFCECKNLELMHAPNVKQTGQYCFLETKLKRIHFPKLKKVSFCTFEDTQIQNIESEDLASCKYVNNRGFAESRIQKLSIPTLICADPCAFIDNPFIEINLPNLRYVDFRVFADCQFSELFLPNLMFAGEFAFENCSQLSELVLGKAKFGKNVLENCQSLQAICCESGPEAFTCDGTNCKEDKCVICRGKLQECFDVGKRLQQFYQTEIENKLAEEGVQLELIEQMQADERVVELKQQLNFVGVINETFNQKLKIVEEKFVQMLKINNDQKDQQIEAMKLQFESQLEAQNRRMELQKAEINQEFREMVGKNTDIAQLTQNQIVDMRIQYENALKAMQ